ncbi:MAG: hypothetical protein PHF86_13130 [Candidatus Nanoarchaeia archaeon]|nr:hypothetical protein [Candidatus Nanoarchaeia archaeon]
MITRYVNTASTAGGNGTTNDIVGANRAFATLQEAETQLTGDNYDDDLEILCCGSAADTVASFDQDSYVTAGHTLYIKGNRGDATGYHGGVWNASTYRIIYNSHCLLINTNRRTIIDGIQLHNSSDVYSNGIYMMKGTTDSEIKNCVIRFVAGSSGIAVGSTYINLKIYNNIISGVNGYYAGCIFFSSPQATTTKVYNNLLTNAVYGIRSANGQYIKNNIIFDCYDDIDGSATIDHCASDDGDGTNPISVSSWADQFHNPNYAAEFDFSLTGTSVLLDAGIGPDSDANVPTTDILAYDRSGLTATVGAFEHEWDWSPVVPSTSNEIQFFGQLHGQLHGQE